MTATGMDPTPPKPGLDSASLDYVEGMYLAYLDDPGAVPVEWQRYFAVGGNGHAERPGRGPSFVARSLFDPLGGVSAQHRDRIGSDAASLHQRLDRLVRNYRVRGHRLADLNPLGWEPFEAPEVDPAYYGFTQDDLDRPVLNTTLAGAHTLGEVIDGLKETYTRRIGAQFMHIDSLAVRAWLQQRMESTRNHLALSRERQLRILTKLTDAVLFEEFIQKKYLGAKSFSLEGAETLIPLLDLALEKAAAQGAREVVLGMAHRGRLNVLANVLGKNLRLIFSEFEDTGPELNLGRGDVKYHLGFSSEWTSASGIPLHLSLTFNPSHLEYVNPVVLGRVRGKQDRRGDQKRQQVVPILIHGDASFIGQGIVQETLNLSGLVGFRVGGTLHIIVNNQVGFTTSPRQARSTTYASDIAKMLQSPILHVNGEDPEAVAQVIELAMDFRQRFRSDVVVDMYCYRRHGHNEGDEPTFTQPVMYAKIRDRDTVRTGYLERLLALGEISREEADHIAEMRREQMEQELSVARSDDFKPYYSAFEGAWARFATEFDADVPEAETGVVPGRARALLEATTVVPDGFHLNPKIARQLRVRAAMGLGEQPLDWAAGEALAFASLVADGIHVRLTGQDTERGTFSHRHAVFHDTEDGHEYVPLRAVGPDPEYFAIHNSPLSEAGVVGFEYGYGLERPDSLVLWEAQYGDFVNAAQVIIDQFIASAEDKWSRLSGVVLLLPHGMEGQGPEHSSARLERFLQLCADDNMQIAYPTTPAQYFHLLRRQVIRPFRKPLIVMTPKSLLRHPRAVSELGDFESGTFQRVIDDATVAAVDVSRVILTSGKLYYELLHAREERAREDVAILRLEQLYPLAVEQLEQALARYPQPADAVWVQEEPENMGAWRFLRITFGETLAGRRFRRVSRPASASPATGSSAAHALEQAEVLQAAFESEAARPGISDHR